MDTFGWEFFLFVFGMIALVLLFMGPAQWSSTTEYPLTMFFRWLRTRRERRRGHAERGGAGSPTDGGA